MYLRLYAVILNVGRGIYANIRIYDRGWKLGVWLNFSRTIPVDEKTLQIYKRFLFCFMTLDITSANLRAMSDLLI